MASNSILRLSFFVLGVGLFAGCGPATKGDKDNEYLIGNKLQNVAPIKASDGTQKSVVALFDEKLQKIHQFDVAKMVCKRTVPVFNPNEKHFVLESETGSYIVDFSEKHLSIFDKNSNRNDETLHFAGKPVSAAFRPDRGILVMYDDLRSVGMMKLSPEGFVEKAHVYGSKVTGGFTISSADINENGQLIMALTDNSIVVADVDTILNSSNWPTMVPQPTMLNKISWIAPIPKMPNRIFIKSQDSVALYDVGSQSVIATLAISSDGVEKFSKSVNPHIIERLNERTVRLIYTDGLSIKTLELPRQVKAILSSELDLAQDTWTYVELSNYTGYSLFNDLNQVRESRWITQIRFSDALSLEHKKLPDRTQISLGSNYFLALYPSDLGRLTKSSIIGNDISELKFFNFKKY